MSLLHRRSAMPLPVCTPVPTSWRSTRRIARVLTVAPLSKRSPSCASAPTPSSWRTAPASRTFVVDSAPAAMCAPRRSRTATRPGAQRSTMAPIFRCCVRQSRSSRACPCAVRVTCTPRPMPRLRYGDHASHDDYQLVCRGDETVGRSAAAQRSVCGVFAARLNQQRQRRPHGVL